MAGLLLIPFILLRFGLLYLLDRDAIRRAAHYAPVEGPERAASVLYQLANIAVFLCPFFLRVKFTPTPIFIAGAIVYMAGNLLLAVSMVNFAAPSGEGLNKKGIYRLSRNPIYLSYFVFFIGCVLLTQSLVLLGITVVLQVTTHWIILAEERWCLETMGDAYRAYMRQVRRYI